MDFVIVSEATALWPVIDPLFGETPEDEAALFDKPEPVELPIPAVKEFVELLETEEVELTICETEEAELKVCETESALEFPGDCGPEFCVADGAIGVAGANAVGAIVMDAFEFVGAAIP